jgi:hypothetical protein
VTSLGDDLASGNPTGWQVLTSCHHNHRCALVRDHAFDLRPPGAAAILDHDRHRPVAVPYTVVDAAVQVVLDAHALQ